VCAPIELLGDKPVIPPYEGIRGGKRCDLFETLATKRIGECGKAAALGIDEPQAAATELGFEHTVLREEIRDNLLLVPLEPASDYGDEDMQDHGVPQVESSAMVMRSSILPT
jgi:hypothetical protein